MARVVVNEIEPGQDRDVARANSTINSWNTNTSNIDEDNFRDESLDYDSMKKEFHEFGDSIEVKSQSGNIVNPVTALVVTEITGPFHIGAFDFTLNEDELVVRFSMEAKGAYVAGVGDDELWVQLGYKTGAGGAVTPISSTRRSLKYYDAGLNANVIRSIGITHRFQAATNSNLYITALAWVSAVGLRSWIVKEAVLTGTLYKR